MNGKRLVSKGLASAFTLSFLVTVLAPVNAGSFTAPASSTADVPLAQVSPTQRSNQSRANRTAETATASPPIAQSVTRTTGLTETAVTTNTAVVTVVETLTGTTILTDTATGAEAAVSSDEQPAVPAQIDDSAYANALEGTILANRTESSVRFFVEGQTFLLDPLRSIGLDLPRVTGVLNLFNCDALIPETEEGCYWDPYLLDRDSFYEIVAGIDAGKAVNLTLRRAGSPTASEIWIQNRTGKAETVVYRNTVYQLPAAAVQEFALDADEIPTFFLRSCVSIGDSGACEWLPVVAEAGVYYALVEIETAGGLTNSTISALDLHPILADDEAVIELPKQVRCRLQVPTLNVRSGPGLDFQILAKVRGTDAEPATVLVVGRNVTADWLAVDERVAAGGWIAGDPSYVACEGELFDLPETEITDGRLAPTPEPALVQSADDQLGASETTDAGASEAVAQDVEGTETIEPTPGPIEIPKGLALVVVNNAFDHEVRFTMDQKYRVELGPSEIDLQPGESANVLVYPGFMAFSASSPWSGLSGNQDFFLDTDQSLTLWLLFMPDPDGSGEWILRY